MILISHPRSGSEMFMQSLNDVFWVGTEIFCEPTPQNMSLWDNRSFSAKMAYLRAMPASKGQKIHAAQIRTTSTQNNTVELISHLASRDDVYFLRRRNIRKSIVSWFVGYINGHNYHRGYNELVASSAMSFDQFFKTYTWMYHDMIWAENTFKYAEKFVFEDLLDGQRPKTLRLDFNLAKTVQRDSFKLRHLITNFDEVVGWMDTMNVEGSL